MKKLNRIRNGLALILCLFSLVLIIWSSWPLRRSHQTLPVQSAILSASTNAVLKEPRRISIDWPEKIRLGDDETISLLLEVDEIGRITPAAGRTGQQVAETSIEAADLFDTHNLIAEARLDMAGVNVLPKGLIQEPLGRGQTLHFYWNIQPQQTGSVRGTLWLFINAIPKTEEGTADRMPLLAKELEIETISVLGLATNWARRIGLMGIGFSLILGFPYFKALWAGMRRRQLAKSPKK